MDKYTDEEISANLSHLPLWQYQHGKLNKQFVFKDFVTAFTFMADIAIYAEAINHHPEWCNVYKKVDVNLMTHEAQGITHLDIDLAKKMDAVENGLNQQDVS